ncbi:MAG: alanine racemase [Bryobacteraceae bacterium]
MSSRRSFLTAGAGSLLAATGVRAAKPTFAFPYSEFEACIARREFREINRDVLPTPCMVVDLDIFEKNLKVMGDHVLSSGIKLRPHVKVHKSLDVAKRQIALGAIGVTTATIAESELMSGGGIKGVLWTKQPASANNLARAITLTRKDPTFMFVIDDPVVQKWVEEAADEAKVKCRVVVSVNAGMLRQGIQNGQPALELAQKMASSKHMSFEGDMAYTGNAAHTHGWEARRKKSADDLLGFRKHCN